MAATTHLIKLTQRVSLCPYDAAAEPVALLASANCRLALLHPPAIRLALWEKLWRNGKLVAVIVQSGVRLFL